MHYGSVKLCDCANGTGCRVVLFVSGCTHHCKGCFQPETWDFRYGKPYTAETEDFLYKEVIKPYCDGITLLGGEPMEPSNQEAVLPLLRRVHAAEKTIWIYSGYTYEELRDPAARCRGPHTDEILALADVLVDGEFHEEEKTIGLPFRGSSNQRILDLKKSLKKGTATLAEGFSKKGGKL